MVYRAIKASAYVSDRALETLKASAKQKATEVRAMKMSGVNIESAGPIERKLHEVQHMNLIAMMWNICRAIDNELAKLQQMASCND